MFRLGTRLSLGLIVLSGFAGCGSLQAQTSLSTLRGTATDQSGAVVPGVAIKLEDTATGVVVRIMSTDQNGNYEMPGLKAGNYRLTASRTGFDSVVAADIILESNQTKRVDVALHVGSTSTKVTVSAAAKVIETEEGNISTETTGEQYKGLPLASNPYSSPVAVVALASTVQMAGSDNGTIVMAGQTNINASIDGVQEETRLPQTANMQAVAEVRVLDVNNSAQYSRIGSYEIVTKRGSNQYHVDASYYLLNSALGARSFFAPSVLPLIYNTINTEASGPVPKLKDRTFFYVLWNGERVHSPSFHLATVPTQAMKSGDFSQLLTQAKPVTVLDPLTKLPFPGNVIPANRLSAVAQNMENAYYPSPNYGAPGALANNYGFTVPYPGDQYHADVFVTRIDQNISSKNSLFGRFSDYLPRYIINGGLPDLDWTRLRQSQSWAINDVHVFSPSVVNTFLFGGNVDNFQDGSPLNGITPLNGLSVANKIGLQGVDPNAVSAQGFPTTTISGFTTLNVSAGQKSTPSENFSVSDDLSWSVGRHVASFGVLVRTYSSFNGQIPNTTYGNFAFDGRFSGYAFADFLLGVPGTSTRQTPIVNRWERAKEMALYATDTFKITRNLTLTYGLRWEYFGAPSFDDGLEYNFNLASGQIVVPNATLGKVSPLYPTSIPIVAGQVVADGSAKNFRPRLAAAYRLNDKTVIRGGYGIFSEALVSSVGGANGPYILSPGAAPFSLTQTYTNSISNGAPLFAFPNPFPATGNGTVPSQSFSGFPLDPGNGIIQQYNVTVERQLRTVGLRVSYIGSHGSGLHYSIGIDKPQPSLTPFSAAENPYPQFVSGSYLRSNGATKYNGLNIEAIRKVGSLVFDWSYTWAAGFLNYTNLENPYAPLAWNHDSFTARQRMVLNVSWEVPVGKGRRFGATMPRALDELAGGWQLVWNSFLSTGMFFTPSYSGVDASHTNTVGGIPNRICNGNLPSGQQSVSEWFNTACFTTPSSGTFGNSGANILEGPGFEAQNVGITKVFPLKERLRLTFSAMVSNLFNHPNFQNPGTNVSVATGGVISGTPDYYSNEGGGPRLLEGRLRLEW